MHGLLLSSGACRVDRNIDCLPADRSPSDSAHIVAIDHDAGMLELIATYLRDYDMRVTALPSARGIADVMAHAREDQHEDRASRGGEGAARQARRCAAGGRSMS